MYTFYQPYSTDTKGCIIGRLTVQSINHKFTDKKYQHTLTNIHGDFIFQMAFKKSPA